MMGQCNVQNHDLLRISELPLQKVNYLVLVTNFSSYMLEIFVPGKIFLIWSIPCVGSFIIYYQHGKTYSKLKVIAFQTGNLCPTTRQSLLSGCISVLNFKMILFSEISVDKS